MTQEHGVLVAHPGLELRDQRCDLRPPREEARIGSKAVDRSLGIEERVDTRDRLKRGR